jgi:hypothetical protein
MLWVAVTSFIFVAFMLRRVSKLPIGLVILDTFPLYAGRWHSYIGIPHPPECLHRERNREKCPGVLAGKRRGHHVSHRVAQSIRSEAIRPISASFRTFREEARVSGVRF